MRSSLIVPINLDGQTTPPPQNPILTIKVPTLQAVIEGLKGGFIVSCLGPQPPSNIGYSYSIFPGGPLYQNTAITPGNVF